MRRRVLGVLAFIFIPGLWRMNKDLEAAMLEAAIEEDDEREWIREAIDIHDQWAKRLEDPSSTMTFREKDSAVDWVMSARALSAIVGDVEHHKRWAERYRKMLERRA